MSFEAQELLRQVGEGRLSRRAFIRRAVALGFSASAIAGFLAACGNEAPATTGAGGGATTTTTTTTTTQAAGAASSPTAVSGGGAQTTRATTGTGTTRAAGAGGNFAASRSNFKGTLQYWVLGYQPNGGNQTGKLTDAAVGAFTKANPDIKVEVTGYTGDQAGFTKLTQAVQGGEGVDIFRLPSDILPLLVQDGLVAPIDDFLTADDRGDIFPNLLEAVSVRGKAYAWPLWVPPVGMYLNLDIFRERGVDPPKGSWTYDQFVETAKRLTFTRANGEQVYGYSGGIDPGLVNTWPFIIGDGALPLDKDATKYTWNTPDAVSGLRKLADLSQKGAHKVAPPDFGAQSVADLGTAFKDRKVLAMYSEPSGSSSGYRSSGVNFDVVPMPIGKSGRPATAGGIGLISVAAIRDRAKLQAAMDLGRYLTSPQIGDDVQGYYLAPGARKSVKVSDPIDKFSPFVESCYITPIIAEWPQIRTIIHPNIQNAVFGQIPPEQALRNPEAEINGILANRRR